MNTCLEPYCISSPTYLSLCLHAWCSLIPSSESLNPTTFPSQHIKCLYKLVTCLLNAVFFSQICEKSKLERYWIHGIVTQFIFQYSFEVTGILSPFLCLNCSNAWISLISFRKDVQNLRGVCGQTNVPAVLHQALCLCVAEPTTATQYF